jgi:DNA-binding response OmpR family regulator
VGAGHADLAHHLECDLFSLVVLDVRAAPYDGFEALRQVRARSDVPVILLAGGRHDDFERVIALEFGADDFLCEPLNFQELLARIRAGAEGDGDPSGLSPDGQISHIDSQGPPPERAAPSFQGDPSCV